jgi:hypothetical protein
MLQRTRTREDKVMTVMHVDGSQIVEHVDGTRITRYFQKTRVQHGDEANKETGTAARWWYCLYSSERMNSYSDRDIN